MLQKYQMYPSPFFDDSLTWNAIDITSRRAIRHAIGDTLCELRVAEEHNAPVICRPYISIRHSRKAGYYTGMSCCSDTESLPTDNQL